MCSSPEQFSPKAKSAIQETTDLELFISDATALEIALKSSLGKLQLPSEPRIWIEEQYSIWAVTALSISREAIYLAAELPWHHKDPFDRLIIATSVIHKLPVITSDLFFGEYGVDVIW